MSAISVEELRAAITKVGDAWVSAGSDSMVLNMLLLICSELDKQPPDPPPAAEPVRKYVAMECDAEIWEVSERYKPSSDAKFFGPDSESRAKAYADFLNTKTSLPTVRELARLYREAERGRINYCHYIDKHGTHPSDGPDGDSEARRLITIWTKAQAALEAALVLVEGAGQ